MKVYVHVPSDQAFVQPAQNAFRFLLQRQRHLIWKFAVDLVYWRYRLADESDSTPRQQKERHAKSIAQPRRAPLRTSTALLRLRESDTLGAISMAKKQSSSTTSTLASKVLSGAAKPTAAQSRKLAASVLSQDEKKGQSGRKR